VPASASLAPLSSLLACSSVVACVCLFRAANCSPNLPFPEPLCARSYSAYYQRSFSEPLSTFLHFIQSHLRFPLKQVLGLPTSAALAAAVLGSSTPTSPAAAPAAAPTVLPGPRIWGGCFVTRDGIGACALPFCTGRENGSSAWEDLPQRLPILVQRTQGGRVRICNAGGELVRRTVTRACHEFALRPGHLSPQYYYSPSVGTWQWESLIDAPTYTAVVDIFKTLANYTYRVATASLYLL